MNKKLFGMAAAATALAGLSACNETPQAGVYKVDNVEAGMAGLSQAQARETIKSYTSYNAVIAFDRTGNVVDMSKASEARLSSEAYILDIDKAYTINDESRYCKVGVSMSGSRTLDSATTIFRLANDGASLCRPLSQLQDDVMMSTEAKGVANYILSCGGRFGIGELEVRRGTCLEFR